MTTSRTTGSRGGELVDAVRAHRLPEDVRPLIETYESTVGDRDRFLWRWLHHLVPSFTLSCVDPARREGLRDAKLLALIYVSVLDDLAEKRGDVATFEEAAKLPFDHQSADPDREGVDREALAFAGDVWERFAPTVTAAPRTAEFGAVFEFDLQQTINVMRYSSLANRDLAFVNGPELETYDGHNVVVFGLADVDLLYSPSFDRAETATLRRVIVHAQRMVRIGNWITTWERELAEGDFTSGVVVRALEDGVVSRDDLAASRADPDPGAVESIAEAIREHAVEGAFMDRWRAELAAAREYEGAVDSVDVAAYLDGIETVMSYHLASRGLK